MTHRTRNAAGLCTPLGLTATSFGSLTAVALLAALSVGTIVRAADAPAAREFTIGGRVIPGVASLTVASKDDPAEQADSRPGVKLSLDMCIYRMLQGNYDIAIERLDPQKALHGIVIEKAAFDPRVTGEVGASQSRIPSRSQIQFGESGATEIEASNSKSVQMTAGLHKKVMTGADLGLSLSARKSDDIVGDTAMNPYYSTDLSLSFTQPLLRDGWWAFNHSNIRIAYNTRSSSVWSFKQSVIGHLFSVQEAYWNLVRAIKNLKVSQDSLHRAKRLYENNRIKVRAGTIPEIEMLQALAEVASQREGVIRGKRSVRDSEDVLKELMNMCGDDGRMSDVRIIPTSLPTFEPVALDLGGCLGLARLHRPEYYMTELELRSERLRLLRNRNQMLPSLDLTGGFTWVGRGSSYHASLRQMDGGNKKPYPLDTKLYRTSVSLQLEYPLGNRAAKSRYLRSRLDVNRRRLERGRSDLRIQREVRDAVRAVQTNIERVKANSVATELQRERLRAEEKKLSVGKSTSFDVLQAQEDLAVAERQEVQSIVDYRISLVSLEQAKGTLLEAANVYVGEDR